MELIIALAVLAIALTGIIAAILNGLATKDHNRQLDLARDAATSVIEQIRARAQSDYGGTQTFYTTNNTFSVDGLVQPSFPVAGVTPTQPASPSTWLYGYGVIMLDTSTLGPDGQNHIMTVRVAVAWGSEGPNRQFETSAIITR